MNQTEEAAELAAGNRLVTWGCTVPAYVGCAVRVTLPRRVLHDLRGSSVHIVTVFAGCGRRVHASLAVNSRSFSVGRNSLLVLTV